MNNNSEQINTIIKLVLGDLNQENPSDSIQNNDNNNDNNDNKENSENFNTSNRDISSQNNPEIKLEESEQNNIKSISTKNNLKVNNKNAAKKSKSRRSRLTIDPQEESTPPHPRKIYTEEEKLKKANENTAYFNWDLINKRNEMNVHFLKRKIEQSYERDDKLQVFFNVPFFPREEMFMPWQLAHNNNYLHNLNRNAQYNKMGVMPNRNMNYPNSMRYANNNINNNMIKNNNNNIGNLNVNNNLKNYGQNYYPGINNNNNNNQTNIKNPNNLTQIPKAQNNIPNPNNKLNQSSTNNNINNNTTINSGVQNPKPAKPILDTSLLKDQNNKNKIDTNNFRKNPLFALTTDSPVKNNGINKSTKKENENNNEIKEEKKEEDNEIKEINIDNKE